MRSLRGPRSSCGPDSCTPDAIAGGYTAIDTRGCALRTLPGGKLIIERSASVPPCNLLGGWRSQRMPEFPDLALCTPTSEADIPASPTGKLAAYYRDRFRRGPLAAEHGIDGFEAGVAGSQRLLYPAYLGSFCGYASSGVDVAHRGLRHEHPKYGGPQPAGYHPSLTGTGDAKGVLDGWRTPGPCYLGSPGRQPNYLGPSCGRLADVPFGINSSHSFSTFRSQVAMKPPSPPRALMKRLYHWGLGQRPNFITGHG